MSARRIGEHIAMTLVIVANHDDAGFVGVLTTRAPTKRNMAGPVAFETDGSGRQRPATVSIGEASCPATRYCRGAESKEHARRQMECIGDRAAEYRGRLIARAPGDVSRSKCDADGGAAGCHETLLKAVCCRQRQARVASACYRPSDGILQPPDRMVPLWNR